MANDNTIAVEQKPMLLVVDDTPENIELLAGVLKDEYRIKAARSGAKAIEIATTVPRPDLILLDIMMPEMDGYEVCQRLKAKSETRHIPIIFVTAKISAQDEIRGLNLGAADYLTKPITPDIARRRIKTHLALYQQNQALYQLTKQQTEEINQGKRELLQVLGKAAEYKDNETGMHVIRVGEYGHILATALGLPVEEADIIREAAPMHDIGKIGIPDHILLKNGKLDDEEWAEMQKHVEYGVDILSTSMSGSRMVDAARLIAGSHHEKWDGSGYPNGLRGNDIPIEGRIIALADVFDALTSERPYKRAWQLEDAVNFIRQQSGKHFDPAIVAAFVEHLDKFVEVQHRYKDE